MRSPVTVVVPIKALAQAKGRLAAALGVHRRIELMTWMLSHVVETCLTAPSVDAVTVIAGDEEAAAAARTLGAHVEIERTPGLDAAMDRADRLLAGCAASLVVAADLPLLTTEDVEAVCAAGPAAAGVVIAPTTDGGTGGLLRRPSRAIGTAYGPGSAAAHHRLAAAAGMVSTEVVTQGFSLDLDTPGQLRALHTIEPRLAPWAV
jgi:2-phospho-L-lactate/phosphoenolpyruvate guanylyltransferase